MKKPTGTTSLFDIVSKVRAVIETVYTKGSAPTGRQSYDGLMLLKIEPLRIWYDLSDEGVEEMVNGLISYSRLVGLAKTHVRHVMEVIAHNLYRAPGLIVANA